MFLTAKIRHGHSRSASASVYTQYCVRNERVYGLCRVARSSRSRRVSGALQLFGALKPHASPSKLACAGRGRIQQCASRGNLRYDLFSAFFPTASSRAPIDTSAQKVESCCMCPCSLRTFSLYPRISARESQQRLPLRLAAGSASIIASLLRCRRLHFTSCHLTAITVVACLWREVGSYSNLESASLTTTCSTPMARCSAVTFCSRGAPAACMLRRLHSPPNARVTNPSLAASIIGGIPVMVCGACSTYLLLCQVWQAALAPCSSVAVLLPIRTVPARTSPLQTEARCR